MSHAGQMVIVPAGTVYHTNDPKRPGDQVAEKRRIVRIIAEGNNKRPCVQWQTSSKHWAWTHPDNVQAIGPDGLPAGVGRCNP